MASRKLTITIPDVLAQRIAPYRDRMNLSRLCADAIAVDVAILEVAIATDAPPVFVCPVLGKQLDCSECYFGDTCSARNSAS